MLKIILISRYSLLSDLRERYKDLPLAASVKNTTMSNSEIKMEPDWDQSENLFIVDIPMNEQDKPEPILLAELTDKKEQLPRHSLSDLSLHTGSQGSKYFFLEQTKVSMKIKNCESTDALEQIDLKVESKEQNQFNTKEVAVKTENCESMGEVDRKAAVIFEEIYVKQEYPEQDQKVIPGSISKEKHDKYKKHKCHVCDYQTKNKGDLNVHLLRHRNPNDLDMFKCDQCDFKSVYNKSLNLHKRRHKNPKDIDMFKCDQCSFKTIHSGSLKKHLYRHIKDDLKNSHLSWHKDVGNIKTYESVEKEDLELKLLRRNSDLLQCSQCKYCTHNKRDLDRHVLQHESVKQLTIFKCSDCEYTTIEKSNLTRHQLRHKEPKKVEIFQCDKCDFKTLHKCHVNRHIYKHKNDVDPLKCNECDFTTVYRKSLESHRQRYHGS